MNEWWKEHGYFAGRDIGSGMWIVLMPMLYTFRVALCTPDAILDFYCYEDLDRAWDAYDAWDGGAVNPVDGYTRHHKMGAA